MAPISSSTPSTPRGRFSDIAVLLGTCVLLAGAAVVSFVLQLGAPDGPPLSARGFGVTGSVALVRWTQALGYDTSIVEGRPFHVPPGSHLLFLLQPNALYTLGEADSAELQSWVRSGGTLVVAVEHNVSYPVTRRGPQQDANGDIASLEAFDFGLLSSDVRPPHAGSTEFVTVTLQQPLSVGGPTGPLVVRTADGLSTPADAQVIAMAGATPVIAQRRLGAGRVIAFSTAYPFSNEGLRDDDNARLVLSLLKLAAPGSLIAFDEYHHGSRQASSIPAWMLTTRSGQGTLLALVLLAGYVLWTGRRFGRVFVAPALRIRRQPSEYVIAMANLARSAGQRHATLKRYRDWLKQRLGRPYRIDPNLGDDDFVAELSKASSNVDAQKLRALLHGLSAPPHRLSAAQFVRLAKEAGEF